MNCRKILVVDDDQAIRESLVQLLELEDYIVVEARDGMEAYDHLLTCGPGELPAMIILDMLMPRMDGTQFLRKIESENVERFKKIPVVIASANAHLTGQTTNLNCVERITKPFDIMTILDIASKYCKK